LIVGSDASGRLVPAAVARYAGGDDRRRAVARALHAGPAPRTVQVADRLAALRDQVASLRARAIELHVKLLERERGGDVEAGELRRRLMASVVQIESVVRGLVETPDPAAGRRR
jgi:hypothetical protein